MRLVSWEVPIPRSVQAGLRSTLVWDVDDWLGQELGFSRAGTCLSVRVFVEGGLR